MKIAFHTLGCKVNQYESEAIAAAFEQQGYTVVDEQGVCRCLRDQYLHGHGCSG